MRLLNTLILAGAIVPTFIGASDCSGGHDGAPAAPARPETQTIAAPVAEQPYAWKNVAIEGGGFVTGIVCHPAVKGLMYARTDVGGAYRSDDKAGTWTPLTDWVSQAQSNLMGCESIAVDPSDPERVYLALGTYTARWSTNGAMARSDDRGHTFQQKSLPFKLGGNDWGRSGGERLAVDPNDGRVLFFGSRTAGLWKSADYAATWSPVTTFPTIAPETIPAGEGANPVGVVFVQFDKSTGRRGTPTRTIYCGVSVSGESFYRTTDGGITWSAIPGQPTGLRPNHIARTSAGVLYLSYGDPAGPGAMTDGAIWKFTPKDGSWTNITPVKPSPNDRFGYGAVSVDATHPDTLMASSFCRWARGDAIFRSTDGGKTWAEQSVRGPKRESTLFDASEAPYAASLAPHWIGDVEIDPFDSNHVLFTTGNGLWVSHDARNIDGRNLAHWAFVNRGLEETVPNALISPPVGAHLLSVIGDFDGFRHDDLDVSPRNGRLSPTIGSNSGIDFAERAPDCMVRSGGTGRAFYSADGGDTWTEFPARPPGADAGGTIALSADGATIVWTAGHAGTCCSHDRGETWAACAGLPRPLPPVADRVDAKKFYAFDREDGTLYVSTDRAESFVAAATGLPKGDSNAIHAVPGFEGDLWLVTGGHLFHSADAGQTFSQQHDLEQVHKCGFGKAAPGQSFPAVYVVARMNGTEGFYRSDDAGATWVRINDVQHQFGWINAITGDPRIYGRVYIGTGGRGVLYGDPVGLRAERAEEKERAGLR